MKDLLKIRDELYEISSACGRIRNLIEEGDFHPAQQDRLRNHLGDFLNYSEQEAIDAYASTLNSLWHLEGEYERAEILTLGLDAFLAKKEPDAYEHNAETRPQE